MRLFEHDVGIKIVNPQYDFAIEVNSSGDLECKPKSNSQTQVFKCVQPPALRDTNRFKICSSTSPEEVWDYVLFDPNRSGQSVCSESHAVVTVDRMYNYNKPVIKTESKYLARNQMWISEPIEGSKCVYIKTPNASEGRYGYLQYKEDGNHLEITKEPNDNKDMLTSESFHWQIVHYEPRVD